MFDQGMNQNFGFDSAISGNDNVINNDTNIDINMMGMNSDNNSFNSTTSSPVNEGVQQRVVNRTFVHNVVQV